MSEDSFLEEEGKESLSYLYFFFSCKKVSEKTGEKKFGRTESVLVFELQPFHHLAWGLAQ